MSLTFCSPIFSLFEMWTELRGICPSSSLTINHTLFSELQYALLNCYSILNVFHYGETPARRWALIICSALPLSLIQTPEAAILPWSNSGHIPARGKAKLGKSAMHALAAIIWASPRRMPKCTAICTGSMRLQVRLQRPIRPDALPHWDFGGSALCAEASEANCTASRMCRMQVQLQMQVQVEVHLPSEFYCRMSLFLYLRWEWGLEGRLLGTCLPEVLAALNLNPRKSPIVGINSARLKHWATTTSHEEDTGSTRGILGCMVLITEANQSHLSSLQLDRKERCTHRRIQLQNPDPKSVDAMGEGSVPTPYAVSEGAKEADRRAEHLPNKR
ncbi:hypothetical protein BKA70DRAFT_1534651 [Coprinopsis sp. MPI-PUGE-AT-0042]|nr:hypothetical protein BKA70DRAFT_1534651 [Coprinopsis sp. MPI-PUGE-AT-0042]